MQNPVEKMNALWSGKATSADRLSLKEIMEICRYIADEYGKYLGENKNWKIIKKQLTDRKKGIIIINVIKVKGNSPKELLWNGLKGITPTTMAIYTS